jgi:hypothetical protein
LQFAAEHVAIGALHHNLDTLQPLDLAPPSTNDRRGVGQPGQIFLRSPVAAGHTQANKPLVSARSNCTRAPPDPQGPAARCRGCCADGHVRVVGAEGRLADHQRPVQLHPSTLQVLKVVQHAAKLVTPPGDLRIAWSKRGLGGASACSAIGLARRYWPRSRR